MKECVRNICITKLNKIFESSEGSLLPSKLGIIFILLLGMSAALMRLESKPSQDKQQQDSTDNRPLDTFIPENKSLIPIQVSNYESLDQVIGQFGVVDLYVPSLDPKKKGRPVARAVKLVRSPESPRHFNVLVPKDEAYKLVGHYGEYMVAVRNPKTVGTEFEKPKVQARRRVVYESEAQ